MSEVVLTLHTNSHSTSSISQPTLLTHSRDDDSIAEINDEQQNNATEPLVPQNDHACTLDIENTSQSQPDTRLNENTPTQDAHQTICRICHCGNSQEKLVTPCNCRGTSQYVHASCLAGWFTKKRNKTCELCLYEVNVKRRGLKPFSMWKFPRGSCDFVGFLFAFYGVILLIFVIMILRIASNGCRTTVCVVLYFVSVISLIYFSYCCGFVEQIKKCWITYLEINRKVVIENREDSTVSMSSFVGGST